MLVYVWLGYIVLYNFLLNEARILYDVGFSFEPVG
jgi:hypothetical protein